MNKERLIESLSRITVENGASPNEAAMAKSKMEKYSAALNTHRTKQPTPVHIYENIPLEEQRFRTEWYRVKRENRKKWLGE